MKPEIGQVWKLVNPEKYYGIGYKDDLFIILSCDNSVFEIGVFWWSGDPIHGEFGGARRNRLYDSEIIEVGEYVGHMDEFQRSKTAKEKQ